MNAFMLPHELAIRADIQQGCEAAFVLHGIAASEIALGFGACSKDYRNGVRLQCEFTLPHQSGSRELDVFGMAPDKSASHMIGIA